MYRAIYLIATIIPTSLQLTTLFINIQVPLSTRKLQAISALRTPTTSQYSEPKHVSFALHTTQSSFKSLIVTSPRLLRAHSKMSQEKAVPTSLRLNECERGHYGQNAPIRYVPEQDPVGDATGDASNQIKLPGNTKTYLKIWNGKGSNESFLDFVITSIGLIKRLGYWKSLDEADEALKKAEELLKASKTAWKDAKKTESNAVTSDDKANASASREEAAEAYSSAQADHKTAQESRDDAADKPFEFYGSNLSQTEQTSWEKIVTQYTAKVPYTDIFGKEQADAPGKTYMSFWDCVKVHLQSRFAYNAAEMQKLYVLAGVKKSAKVTVRQFSDRIGTLNDAIEYLPMRFYSPQATERTIKCVKFDDYEMVANIMRGLPESWQNDLLKSVRGELPETTRDLIPLLELIEKSPPTPTIPKKEKPVETPAVGGTSKKRHGGGASGSRKKARFVYNKCKLCEKHGGKPETHATEKCRRWNADGTAKSFETGKKDKKAHKAYAQLQSKFDKNNQLLKKLLKKEAKKDKKRSRRSRYDSFDSDSDSS